MNLHNLIFTENDCYKTGQTIKVKGVMVHSTGANNPWLKRYVGPDDGKLGKNQYNNHWNQPMSPGVCVHGFIGKLADGTIASYQTLPWDHRGWHCGSGKNGSANSTHVSFEICEDGLEDAVYFAQVYREAVELTAHICKLYDLDPLKDGVVIDHGDGHARGLASNHGDVMHWFPKHGKSMDTFRADVKALMSGSVNTAQPETPKAEIIYRVQVGAFSKKAYAEKKLEAVKAAGFDGYLTAGRDNIWRVQVGAFRSKAYAEAYLAKVTEADFSGYVTSAGGSVPVEPDPLESVDEIAREVIRGKWGNGTDRKKRLEAAGYDYREVQNRVNQLMK